MNGSGAEFVHGLPGLTKTLLFNFMLNMAYLSNMLANITSGTDGLGGMCAVFLLQRIWIPLSFLW